MRSDRITVTTTSIGETLATIAPAAGNQVYTNALNEIRKLWEPDLRRYTDRRRQYLIY